MKLRLSVSGSLRLFSQGFTLIEVLIAIALVAVLCGAMFGFLFDMLASRSKALEAAHQQRAAATVIDRIEADLMSCIVGDGAYGPGVKGQSQQLRIMSRGVLAALAQRGYDDPLTLGDLQFSEYRFNAAAHQLEARRGAASPSLGAGPANTPGSESRAAAGAPFSPLQGVVYKVRFRYHDGVQWLDSFDSLERNTLPKAVEVAMWFRPLPNQDQTDAADSALSDSMQDKAEASSRAPPGAKAFDEFEFARRAEQGQSDEPAPHRVRVVLIPDSGN